MSLSWSRILHPIIAGMKASPSASPTTLADRHRAQALGDDLSPDHLHRVLDSQAALCCPILDMFGHSYDWCPWP